MRLEKYINESFNIEDYIPILKKECKPYLKECKSIGYFLYRASNYSYDVKKIKPRIDRKPKDTPLELHNYLNELFYKKFGWKARSEGVFTSSDMTLIDRFGENRYIFFPIGEYKYLWSPKIYDLFATLKKSHIINWKNKIKLKIIINNYRNDNLYSAICSGNEVMFKCNEYYMINIKYFNILKKELL